VKSYRLFSNNPLPFAIICEEENKFTASFDDVIIVESATHSFLDKFQLLRMCPYEENIFIDSDSLAYGDLNEYWNIFYDSTDFSSIGDNLQKNQEKDSWYDIKDIGKYGDMIDYIVRIHSGVCYIRKSQSLKKMYDDCMDIVNNWSSIKVRYSPWLTDEAVFDIAMPMNNMRAVPEVTDLMGYLPCLQDYSIDMTNGICKYTTIYGKHSNQGRLIHWSNGKTYESMYRIEVLKMKVLTNEKSRVYLYFLKWISMFYQIEKIVHDRIDVFTRKVRVKLKLMLKK